MITGWIASIIFGWLFVPSAGGMVHCENRISAIH